MSRKRVVSRAQFRFFVNALARLQQGQPVDVDLTKEELFEALQDVDYDSLPERSSKAAPKRPAKPTPGGKYIALQETIEKARERATAPLPPICTHDKARIIHLDDYLDRHPQHPLNRDPAVRKAVNGGLMVQVEPDDLPHWLLRTKTAVKAVLQADPRFDRSRLWSLTEVQVFLASFGTSVKTMDEAARQMAWCPACAGDVPKEETLLMRRWPQKVELPHELQGAVD
jgi:hypothetical protein